MASQITLKQAKVGADSDSIFSILNEYISPTSSTTAPKAVAAFTGRDDRTYDEAFMWEFWKNIISVAEQLPHDHPAQDKVVAFVRELTLVPDTGVKVWDQRVWTDLPILNAAIREHLNEPRVPDDAEERKQLTKRRVNFFAFEARLLHAGIYFSENTPVWMLRAALEEEGITSKESAGDGPFERALMIAAVYIEYAGPTLVRLLEVNSEQALDERQKRMLRGGELFKGPSGLSGDRWAFWTTRFGELGEKATGEARDMAVRAARLMEVWSRATKGESK
ncbi:hypothetical protein F5Y15DRAFT_417772 [Xylariaceae sp. FL0016]|nr:hypothetical protein F5Y15DRAFT_417772 [Xylariaceae sp. FL0016]